MSAAAAAAWCRPEIRRVKFFDEKLRQLGIVPACGGRLRDVGVEARRTVHIVKCRACPHRIVGTGRWEEAAMSVDPDREYEGAAEGARWTPRGSELIARTLTR